MKKLFLYFFIALTLSSCKDKDSYYDLKPKAQSPAFLISDSIIPDSHFLGDNKCKQCHQNQYKLWEGSHHDKAMQIADSTSILGNFNNYTFNSQGVKSFFFKKNNQYYVNTEGPDGNNHDYKIVYTFGIEPLQQYIVQFPNGHFQCLRTAWDTKEKKWFDLYPDFKIVHSEWLHWSRGGLNWNTMCSDCHSTNVRKNYNPDTKSYNTKYAIINVNCEACHGPGKQHVDAVKTLGNAYTNSGHLQMTSNTSPKTLVDQCARCHMRREQISSNYNYKGTLLDHYSPQLIEEPLYHPDGQIKDEVYVYGSFLQSKMYQNDVSCNNCHDSHSLKLKFEGNQLCAQCHDVKIYDTPKHHFHKSNTDGSKCINCHMTGTYYMGNDFRRDHSFRIPRPDLSLKYNTPNACTNCHKDKNNKWAWNAFKNLFGTVDSVHFSDKLTPGLLGNPHGDKALLDLVSDNTQPDIIRASAIKGLSNYNIERFIDTYLKHLNDKSPLVRAASLDMLNEANVAMNLKSYLPLLKDPKRSVRIKAFFGLSTLDENQIPSKDLSTYKKVKQEFYTYLNTNSDFVGGQFTASNYYLKKGNLSKAIEHCENALEIDVSNNQVRMNLANLYYQKKNFLKAEETFKTIIKQEPKYGLTYFSLALLYAEQNRTDDAINQLLNAIKHMPENPRPYYNLSLLYDSKRDFEKGEKALQSGLKTNPNDETLLYALAYHYYNTNQYIKAKKVLTKLVNLHPDNIQYYKFLQVVSHLN